MKENILTFCFQLATFILISYTIAYFLGKKRHIGFKWSFFFCIFLSPIIGLIITLLSKGYEKKKPSPSENTVMIGWGIFIIGAIAGLGIIFLSENSSDPNTNFYLIYMLCSIIGFVGLGSYLISLGKGKIFNNKIPAPDIKEKDISTGNTNVPTKIQTQDWILEKLNNYSLSQNHPVFDLTLEHPKEPKEIKSYTRYEFAFSDSFLLINLILNNTKDTQVQIPIYDFKQIIKRNQQILFTTLGDTIVYNDLINKEKSVSCFYAIGFKTNGETDLPQRIETALNHLKIFYTKPSAKELF